MKKVLMVLLLTILMGLVGCQSAEIESAIDYAAIIAELQTENELLQQILWDNRIFDTERHPIDVSLLETMQTREGATTQGMVIAFGAHGDMWRDEMERYLELLTGLLRDDRAHWLFESQQSWRRFMKDNEELRYHTYYQRSMGSGTIRHIRNARIYYERYRTRALELRYLYMNLTVDGF